MRALSDARKGPALDCATDFVGSLVKAGKTHDFNNSLKPEQLVQTLSGGTYAAPKCQIRAV